MNREERRLAAGAYMVGCLFIIAGALSFGPGWGLVVLGISIIIPAIFGKSTK